MVNYLRGEGRRQADRHLRGRGRRPGSVGRGGRGRRRIRRPRGPASRPGHDFAEEEGEAERGIQPRDSARWDQGYHRVQS